MTNAHFTDLAQYQDVESINYYHILRDKGLSEEETYKILGARSRDNGRTPMQWTAGANGGFTTGTPWLAVNPNHDTINAEAALADGDSVLHYYRQLVELRKSSDLVQAGEFAPLPAEDDRVFGYTRTLDGRTMVVLCNFYGAEAPVTLPEALCTGAKPVLSNINKRDLTPAMTLAPYEAGVWEV